MTDENLIKTLNSFNEGIKNNTMHILDSFKEDNKNDTMQILDSFKKDIKDDTMQILDSFKKDIKDDTIQTLDSFKKDIKDDTIQTLDSFKKDIKNEFDITNSKINSLDSRVSSLEHICALIQYEHGRKLNAILDYIHQDMQDKEFFKDNFNEYDQKLQDHSIRLAILESSKVYKSHLENSKKDNIDESDILSK